jgi:peptide/nickel transport system permease protein
MAELVEPVPASPRTASTDDVDFMRVRTGADRTWRTLRRNPIFWVGLVLAGGMLGAAVLAPVLAPYDPLEQFRDAIPASGDPAGPSDRFLLGTDRSGRDYLSRLLWGARTSLIIGIGANVLATVLGLAVGATAALAGSPAVTVRGRRFGLPVESSLMRLTDLWLSFPILLLTITMAFVFGASVGLVVIIIGTTLWTATARLVYGRTLVLREAEFVQASRALGSTTRTIFFRHLFPHLLPLLVVYASLGIAATVLFEATLSYLGAGVPPPTPTWGTMLADHITYFRTDPRLVLLPGLCITITVLGFNLLGDALRDALDPRAWRQ